MLAVSARRGVTPALEAVFVIMSWGWVGKRLGGKVPFVGRESLDNPPSTNSRLKRAAKYGHGNLPPAIQPHVEFFSLRFNFCGTSHWSR